VDYFVGRLALQERDAARRKKIARLELSQDEWTRVQKLISILSVSPYINIFMIRRCSCESCLCGLVCRVSAALVFDRPGTNTSLGIARTRSTAQCMVVPFWTLEIRRFS
jgi:hypothetical protein